MRLPRWFAAACAALSASAVTAPGSIESVPLAAPSPDPNSTALFSELDPDAIGVGTFVNVYDSEKVWGPRWREYVVGTTGTGVAIGDIDGDQFPDIFAASKDGESRLFRNKGDFTFEDITEASGFVDTPEASSGCSLVDVDNDGDLDLYTCQVAGKNQLWINDGTGHFVERAAAWGVDISSGCTQASFADYDHDGDLDFYLQNNLIADGVGWKRLPDQLFENLGDRFIETTARAGIAGEGHGHSAVWWDFDEDLWPDIYVAHDYNDLDKLYRNNRDGTFTDVISEVCPNAPFYSMGSDFGDIDNDGHSDFLVADMAATNRSHHLRTVGNHGHIYGHNPRGETPQSLKNVLLHKIAPNHFAEIAFLAGVAATDWTWAIRLVDLNNDGRLDTYVTNGMLRPFHDGDLGMRRDRYSEDEGMRAIFRNQPVLEETNLAFENLGDLRFEHREKAWGLDKHGVSFGAAFGDLDRDGDLDLVVSNFRDKLSVYRNNDTHTHRITVRLHGVKTNSWGLGARVTVIAGNLRQTKELSSMRGYMSTDEPILHFGLGGESAIQALEVHWPGGNRQRFADLPVDRHYIITEEPAPPEPASDADSPTLFTPSRIQLPEQAYRRETYFSDFKVQKLLPFRESRLGGTIRLADLNDDGKLDIVLSGSLGQETTVLLNAGNGSFELSPSFDFENDFGCEDWDLHLVDWNHDGALDLLAASGGVESPEGDPFYTDRLYLNDGHGEFTREWDVAFDNLTEATRVARTADIDGDGDPDLFLGTRTVPQKYPYAGPSSLWKSEGGELVRIDATNAPGLAETGRVSDADWADIDNDGDPDLLLCREWDTPQIWRNDHGHLTIVDDAFGSTPLKGLWNCLEVHDLDGDGRLDILLGNLGLNTEYRATEDEPIRLWYSQFDDEPVRLIETFIDDGKEWTREVRWRLEPVFPRQLRRVRSFEQFATMTFQELFPGLEQQGYRYVEANELRMGILWQQPDGSFDFQPLPSFAQVGRAMDFLVQDVDSDGHEDIFISLEPITPEPWSGRWEKGYVALFSGKGGHHFERVSAWQTGLVINGSPRGMAWGDLDGDHVPELMVYLSEGMPVIFSQTSDLPASE